MPKGLRKGLSLPISFSLMYSNKPLLSPSLLPGQPRACSVTREEGMEYTLRWGLVSDSVSWGLSPVCCGLSPVCWPFVGLSWSPSIGWVVNRTIPTTSDETVYISTKYQWQLMYIVQSVNNVPPVCTYYLTICRNLAVCTQCLPLITAILIYCQSYSILSNFRTGIVPGYSLNNCQSKMESVICAVLKPLKRW